MKTRVLEIFSPIDSIRIITLIEILGVLAFLNLLLFDALIADLLEVLGIYRMQGILRLVVGPSIVCIERPYLKRSAVTVCQIHVLRQK